MSRYDHNAQAVPCSRCGAGAGHPCIVIINWPEYQPSMYFDAVRKLDARLMRDRGGWANVHIQRKRDHERSQLPASAWRSAHR